MNDPRTKDLVYDVLVELTGVDKSEIDAETELVAGLGIDSPLAAQLVAALEDALDRDISDEEAAALETVGDVLRLAGR